MSATSFAVIAVLLLNVSVFAAFSLASQKVRWSLQKSGGRVRPGKALFRASAWGLLLVASALAIGVQGVGIGLALAAGSASIAALVALMLASFKPHWLCAVCGLSVVLAGLTWLASVNFS